MQNNIEENNKLDRIIQSRLKKLQFGLGHWENGLITYLTGDRDSQITVKVKQIIDKTTQNKKKTK